MFGRIIITAVLVTLTLASGHGSLNLARALARSDFATARTVPGDKGSLPGQAR